MPPKKPKYKITEENRQRYQEGVQQVVNELLDTLSHSRVVVEWTQHFTEGTISNHYAVIRLPSSMGWSWVHLGKLFDFASEHGCKLSIDGNADALLWYPSIKDAG